MILHIPHASKTIPDKYRDQFVLSEEELKAELFRMTDAYTDELFAFPGATTICFPVSRLVVDVERFPDDADEPMSRVGMGMIYTHTADGRALRRRLDPREKAELKARFYDTHHDRLTRAVHAELDQQGRGLIVDCHSFPSLPLPCDRDQSVPRPHFCIGTDPFHTPEDLSRLMAETVEEMGYEVGLNRPYAGTIVPLECLGKDDRVASLMIEVNRSLYMDEKTGAKTEPFDSIKQFIQGILNSVSEFDVAPAAATPADC